MRSFSSDDAKLLKSATAASYEALGGVSRAAEQLGVRSSTLTKYASTSEEWSESFIRLDLAIELDRRTTHPFMSQMAKRLIENVSPRSFGAVTASAVLRLDRALDDVVRAVVDAIEDDHIDMTERTMIREKIVIAKEFLARLDIMVSGGG